MYGDATSSSSCQKVIEACMAKHGRIDILVNNVGRSEPGGPAEMSEEVWDKQMDVNLKSVYLYCHIVLPIMERQGKGAIVNISSVAGLRYIGKPRVAYSAAKAAIIQFTKATTIIYAPKNVRLNTVVPGLMNTPLVKLLADKYAGGDYQGFCRKRDGQVPTGKMYELDPYVLFSTKTNPFTGVMRGMSLIVRCSSYRTKQDISQGRKLS